MDSDANTEGNFNSSLKATESDMPDVVYTDSDAYTERDVNSSLGVTESNSSDAMQPDISGMEHDRLFEQVSSWMKKKYQALYEQVTISFQFNVLCTVCSFGVKCFCSSTRTQ